MKRLAWILLAVFCTALAQVQPVELVVRQKHGCCECQGRCGMPDCALPAPHAPTAFVSECAATVVRVTAVRSDRRAQKSAEKFFASMASSGVSPVTRPAPVQLAPAASVPLFKAYCSFLI